MQTRGQGSERGGKRGKKGRGWEHQVGMPCSAAVGQCRQTPAQRVTRYQAYHPPYTVPRSRKNEAPVALPGPKTVVRSSTASASSLWAVSSAAWLSPAHLPLPAAAAGDTASICGAGYMRSKHRLVGSKHKVVGCWLAGAWHNLVSAFQLWSAGRPRLLAPRCPARPKTHTSGSSPGRPLGSAGRADLRAVRSGPA